MAQLLIRGLPEEVKEGLRAQAQRNGRSMEAEARQILCGAIDISTSGNVVIDYEGNLDPESLYRHFGIEVLPKIAGGREVTLDDVRRIQSEADREDYEESMR